MSFNNFWSKSMGVSYRGKYIPRILSNQFNILVLSFMIRSSRMRWTGYVARMGEKRNAYRLLVGMPEGKRPLRRPRRRGVDNIKMDLREIRWDGMIGLIWIRIGTSGGLL
jgi:hypothetical protein